MKTNGVILVATMILNVLPASGLCAAAIDGGGLALEFDKFGEITGVRAGDRTVSNPEFPGGIYIRDVTSGPEILAEVSEEGFETGAFDWFLPPINGSIHFTPVNIAPLNGRWSLLCALDETAQDRQTAAAVSPVMPVEPGGRYRLQCIYQASRGYLSSDPNWHTLYQSGFLATNGLGIFWSDAEGQISTEAFEFVAPFAKQALGIKPAGGEFTVPHDVQFIRIGLIADLYPDYPGEAFTVDDIELFRIATCDTPVQGYLENAGNTAFFEGTTDAVRVETRWTGGADSVLVSGTVVSADGASHAFDVVVSLPVDADHWLWLDDAYTHREVHCDWGEDYMLAVSADSQANLPVSLYPFGGVQDAVSGIACAIPLEPVTVPLIRYSAGRRALEAVFHGAVRPGTEHDTFNFACRFFLFTPEDGFRSMIETFHRMYNPAHPEWFSSPFDASPFTYFSVGQYGSRNGAETCRDEDLSGTMSVQYTVLDLTIPDVGGEDDPPPTLPELFDEIARRASVPDECRSFYYRNVPGQISAGVNGDPILKFISVKSWTGGKIEAVLKINPSPGILDEGIDAYMDACILTPAFYATMYPPEEWQVEPSVLDAVQLDNFLASASIDCNPAHFKHTGECLTYSMQDYSPGVPQAAVNLEYMKWLRQWLNTHVPEPPYRGIQINWKGLGIANCALPYVDICAGEVDNAIVNGEYTQTFDPWRNFNPSIQFYKRVLAYHKLRGMAFAGDGITENDVRETLETCLLYGIGAGFKRETKFVSPFTIQKAVKLCVDYNRFISMLYLAGWEPITGAVADSPEIFLERYGNTSRERFFIVAHNFSESPAEARITLTARLNMTTQPAVRELLHDMTPDISSDGAGGWRLTLPPLEPRRSWLLMITPDTRRPDSRTRDIRQK